MLNQDSTSAKDQRDVKKKAKEVPFILCDSSQDHQESQHDRQCDPAQ